MEQKTKEKSGQDRMERMVEAERELGKRIAESELSSDEEQDQRDSVIQRIRYKMDKNRKEVYGEVSNVKLDERDKGSDRIRLEVKHSDGRFTESFRIPKSSDHINKDRYPILRLMEYKSVNRGKFLDLRGKKVPISKKLGRDGKIVVPENTDKRISMEIFQIFQGARRYNMIKESKRIRGNKFVTTTLGNYVAGMIISPSLIVIGYTLGFAATTVAQIPFVGIVAAPIILISMMMSLAGILGVMLLSLITAATIFIGSLSGMFKGIAYVRDEYMPF